MFDHNAMAERAALARSRNGGGKSHKSHKVYKSSKTYHDTHGYKDLSPWQQLVYRVTLQWRQSADMAKEHYRLECRLSQEGFRHGKTIPF